jgi:hypothetical protein
MQRLDLFIVCSLSADLDGSDLGADLEMLGGELEMGGSGNDAGDTMPDHYLRPSARMHE